MAEKLKFTKVTGTVLAALTTAQPCEPGGLKQLC